jgi:hypothetical protein
VGVKEELCVEKRLAKKIQSIVFLAISRKSRVVTNINRGMSDR